METSAPIVFRPLGSTRVRTLGFAIPLLVVSIAIIVLANPAGGVLIVLPLLGLTTFRQRAVLGDDDLVVRGRFTSRRLDLARLERAHEDRTRCVWVAAADQKPFRIYFIPAGESGNGSAMGAVHSGQTFVAEIRRRAVARGARIDVHAELIARPVKGTSPLFSL